jgi:hypothetical protein
MKPLSYKYKIYFLAAGTVVLAIIFFFFVYGSMNNRNQALADAMAKKEQEHEEVLAEQKSYESGKKDLETLQLKPFHPDDLFSQDTKVVKEIQTLEALGKNLGISFSLKVSGSASTATKLPKAAGQVLAVPYTMVVEGPFDKITNFVEATEHLPFITQVKNIQVSALSNTTVRATLFSEFYIKP